MTNITWIFHKAGLNGGVMRGAGEEKHMRSHLGIRMSNMWKMLLWSYKTLTQNTMCAGKATVLMTLRSLPIEQRDSSLMVCLSLTGIGELVRTEGKLDGMKCKVSLEENLF